jgi:4-hydroxy-tetrahydrodipicolinate reductase
LIKIAVGGAQGRVGQNIVQLVQQDKDLQLIAAVIRPGSTKPINSSMGQESLPLAKGLASVENPFDVFIDFSNATCLLEHLELCRKRKQAMVIGVTGLSPEQKESIQKTSQDIPIVFSPNMSIGINVSFKLLEIAAAVLKEEVDVGIHEIHHTKKKDMPSGTALKMAEIIARIWGKTLPTPEINIASNRVAEVPGDHTVLFALKDERLEITHRTDDRAIFARGALRAAKWVARKSPGLYDMQDVLSLKG